MVNRLFTRSWQTRVTQLAISDVKAVAGLHRLAFDHALPWLAGLHTAQEDEEFFALNVFSTCTVMGIWERDQLAGFIAFRSEWVDQLYIRPDRQGMGLGGRLMAEPMRFSRRLNLWTFQRNHVARRFYESRGFVLVEETDGATNEEQEADCRYVWRAASARALHRR